MRRTATSEAVFRTTVLTVALALLPALVGVPLAASAAATGYTPPDLRQRLDLNADWRFVRSDVTGAQVPGFDDRTWQKVSTPHTWNAADGADGGDDYHRGVGWYRKTLTVPAHLAGKRLYLQFAGVNQVADVWVNGIHLGRHEGGYARFRFDATAAVRVGADNVLAVRVDNSHDPDIAPLRADFSFSGGIYRNVSLWAVDPLQVRMLDFGGPGVYLRQRAVSAASATVDVTTRLWNNHADPRRLAVRTVLTDAEGHVVTEHTSGTSTVAARTGTEVVQTLALERPRLWDGVADPYLYRAHVEVVDRATGRVTDVVSQPLGLRTVAVDPDRGFFLNGEHLPLRGVNLHQDRADVGWAQSNAHHVEDFDLIEEMGANAVRMAHYQHDQKDYRLADERGMVVYAEVPFINDYTDTPAFERNVRQQLVEMIRQNYNHPSIVFWGIGNEERVDDARTNELLAGLSDLADAEDPDRITTYASCCLSDDSRVTGHAETSSYNKYFGWYGSPHRQTFGQWADARHAAEPDKAIGISEYGAGANTTHHALDPVKPETTGRWHPEEYQALFHERVWRDIEARPFIWGSFVWNMFDFASDRRSEGDQPGINDKGLVTRDRTVRKDAYYFYKASWATAPTLHVTSRRWSQRTDPLTDVKVYSNASSVAATVNGRALGSRTGDGVVFRWEDVRLDPGRNVVTVTATVAGRRVTDTVTWTLGTRPGRARIESETHDRQTGTEIRDTADGGPGMHVGYVERGDTLAYRRVDLGSTSPRRVVTRLASDSRAGGVVEYRVGSATGPVVASVPVTSTGGWQRWTTVSAPLTRTLTGVQDVHVTFRSSGSGGIANLNWFTFDD